MKSTYIYLIEVSSNSVYIGKTVNPKSREYCHKSNYGKDIKYGVIDEISSIASKDWKPLESYWIAQFKQWGFTVLNKNEGGGGSSFKSQESIDRVSSKLRKKIYQYNIDGNLIHIWNSIKEAKTIYPVDINGCLKGNTKLAGGFIWKYSPSKNISFHLTPKAGKQVIQSHINGDVIKIWRSANDAERYFNQKPGDNIAACCRKKQKTAYGYLWSYQYL
jgi:hypothetical protein